MDKKIALKIGWIGLIIGIILLAIGIPQYTEAQNMINMGIKYGYSVTHNLAWTENLNQAKIFLGLGGGIAVISIIFILIGFTLKDSFHEIIPNQETKEDNVVKKLEILKDTYEKGLITAEEFEKKKSQILSEL